MYKLLVKAKKSIVLQIINNPHTLYHQESLCTPAGTECYQHVKDAPEKCVTPCKGLYADVKKDVEIKKVEEMSKFDKLISDYEKYKRGNNKEIFYPEEIISKIIEDIYSKWSDCLFLGYKSKSKVNFVRIYFATPTFDRITKDEKANFETKFSAVGGTMGLLTGFSIISGVETIYYAFKIILGRVKKIIK